jgi:2-keto-4-pentenoate hydratase/2-oxohepta-3-ene-1,7-dioic acid hydratase in catechol pathway
MLLSCRGRPSLPVGKIVAVGRNYADHVREMAPGASRSAPLVPDAEPILFLKPASALVVCDGATASEVELPPFSRLVHHEVELVVRVGRGGRRFTRDEAFASVDALAVGLDLTARDLQNAAKRQGDPWSVAKGFDQSAPLSPLVPFDAATERERLAALELTLAVNGTVRQRGCTADLITPVVELVAFVSSRFRLEPGDLLFTGTPAGVGPLLAGDEAVAELRVRGASGASLTRLAIRCVAPKT